jgi:hypothetical protein
MMVGSMLLGALASVWGAPHAVAVMGVAGALAMIGISVAMPHARRIR